MTSPSDQWERVQALFHAALEHPSAERGAWLLRTVPDQALREAVERLLAADEQAMPLLDGGLAAAAAGVLASGEVLPHQEFGPYRLVRMLG